MNLNVWEAVYFRHDFPALAQLTPGVQVSGAALAEIGLAIPPLRPLEAAIILIEAC